MTYLSIMPSEKHLKRTLILDELFDLTLYRRLSKFASGETKRILYALIPVETGHFEFWQDFSGIKLDRLNFSRRLKLEILILAARIFGNSAIHLELEATEIYGIRKYLAVWELYKDQPLGESVRGVLYDEFKHEDALVSEVASRKVNPENVRDIFLGLNDGLVEILGAVSGFFAAFATVSAVLIAGFTVAVAGSLSMAAGVFVAIGSEREIENMESKKKRFLGEPERTDGKTSPLKSAIIVGVSYFIGAMFPVIPVIMGSKNLFLPVASAGIAIIIISYVLAFLSGMNPSRRIATNVGIIAITVVVTYAIGIFAKAVWGVNI